MGLSRGAHLVSLALEAFGSVGDWLGVGVANLVAGFDPDVVVVGGGVSAAGDLLLRAPLGSAWERVDRLRRALADRPFVPEFGGDPQRITFSAGLAAWPQDGADLSALLHSADRRLRQSKRDGGNRVVARDF